MIKNKFYSVFCLFFIAMLFSGCDRGVEVVNYEFGQPPRVVYIVGVDTELDFTEATLVSTARDGHQYEFSFPDPGRWLSIEHAVDFNIPGIYKVEVFIHRLSLSFFVQVIDEEIFNELKSGVR